MTVFNPGDRVRLIKEFRCRGDVKDFEERLDRELRGPEGSFQPAGVVVRVTKEYTEVEWDHDTTFTEMRDLKVDHDALELDPPLTDEEVEAAVQSILNGASDG